MNNDIKTLGEFYALEAYKGNMSLEEAMDWVHASTHVLHSGRAQVITGANMSSYEKLESEAECIASVLVPYNKLMDENKNDLSKTHNQNNQEEEK
jgi:hypothetical protein